MKLGVKKRDYKFNEKDTLVFFLSEKEAKKPSSYHVSYGFFNNIDLSYFKGKAFETLFVPLSKNPNLILCGLGKKEEIDDELLRNASASITSLCRDRGITDINISVPDLDGKDEPDIIRLIAEGLTLSNYSFIKYKSKNEEEIKPLVMKAFFITQGNNISGKLKEIEIITRNTHLCRDLVNETSENSNSIKIAGEAEKISRIKGIGVKIYGKSEIEKMRMGLFLAVNKGSSIPPRLVVVKYTGDPGNKNYFAIVGKGITFDSGGINLKPSGHLETMRMDMSGAAIALYTVKAAAELGLKKNIYAVMPLTENMLSNESYRPGDVFKSYNGKTVEIGNTDAEGRLILADAIAFTEDKLKPSVIVDIATLTGACIVAFGETVAGFLTNDDGLAGALESASKKTGEKIWRLPLFSEYDECLKSDIADINNISIEKNAGAIIGAVFLKNFIKKTKWAHIDIAGTAWYSKTRGYRPKYATGYGVRLLLEAITNWKENKGDDKKQTAARHQ